VKGINHCTVQNRVRGRRPGYHKKDNQNASRGKENAERTSRTGSKNGRPEKKRQDLGRGTQGHRGYPADLQQRKYGNSKRRLQS